MGSTGICRSFAVLRARTARRNSRHGSSLPIGAGLPALARPQIQSTERQPYAGLLQRRKARRQVNRRVHIAQLRAGVLRRPDAIRHRASAHLQALLQRGVGPDMQITGQLPVGGIEGGIDRREIRRRARAHGFFPALEGRRQPGGHQVIDP